MSKGARGLTREDVQLAIKQTHSNLGAARLLGISKPTWKKYASMYTDEDGVTLYDKHSNKYGLGAPRDATKNVKRPTVMDVLSGKVPASFFKPGDLRAMLINEGILAQECSCCGFKEERLSDHKIPLLLTFRNLNRKDWSMDNLQLLCYNCYFMQIGDVFTRQQISSIEGTMVHKKYADVQEVLGLSDEHFRKIEEMWEKAIIVEEDLSGEDLISRH